MTSSDAGPRDGWAWDGAPPLAGRAPQAASKGSPATAPAGRARRASAPRRVVRRPVRGAAGPAARCAPGGGETTATRDLSMVDSFRTPLYSRAVAACSSSSESLTAIERRDAFLWGGDCALPRGSLVPTEAPTR